MYQPCRHIVLVNNDMKPAKTSTQPTAIRPMLATLVKQAFTSPEYVYEVKWDGYRIIAYCLGDQVKLQSRGGEDYSKKYPSIVRALKGMSINCILDGEVVYINEEGKPDFDALQKVNGQKAPIVYYAFDLVWLDGESLMQKKLIERKKMLRKLIPGNDAVIKFSDHFDDGINLFEHVKHIGLEGIVAKLKNSPYIPDDRSKKWLKITTEKRQEFVIGGWVESEKRNTFRTLLFGVYENGKLKWKGHAGGGFKEREMPAILEKLKAIEIDENPFDGEVEYSEGKPHWVKPEIVANIKFATTTKSGKIRKPAIFLGFRDDKKPEQVENENARALPDLGVKENGRRPKVEEADRAAKRPATPEGSNWRAIDREPVRNREQFQIGSCSITLHNVETKIWKSVTKAELIQYYHTVSEAILPHVQHRPQSLYVKLKGPHAPGLYIKDMEGRQPECAEIFSTVRKHKKADRRDVIDYLVCNNTATLLYIVDLGCIDINPWTSTVHNSLHPDFVIIDLDPSDSDFSKAVETARAANQFFGEHNLKAYAKTSGKTGIHLFVPCSAFTFPQARRIAENICDEIHRLVPAITTTEISVADRGSKLYLDPNQNDYADTVASAYSVRPFKMPLVSTPLEWKELTDSLSAAQFTMDNVLKRLEKKGDLFLPTLDKKTAIRNDRYLSQFLSTTEIIAAK
jgi:bifunctional non-homologous end joining protein LigD